MSSGTRLLVPGFDAGDARLSQQVQRYWGAFVRTGRPAVTGEPQWPGVAGTGSVLSLQPAGATRLVSDATLAGEHQCGFWGPLRG
jgi:para-nitrobenzyl esterase